MASITQLLVAELDREFPGTRRTLERVPEGRNDWKPHEKSMQLGYLAGLVATMPAWMVSILEEPSLDLAAPGRYRTGAFASTAGLVAAFDAAAGEARAALLRATDEHLLATTWKLLMNGRILSEQNRYEALRDGALNHLYHHRAQLTIYLRLNGRPVPGLYGPSADENNFG
ncbi:MAG TPA: DinB family protein [Gemmatimonadales bacterium]|nr:DinB family protein [Gemmatimonadales bacterium]